MAADFSPLDTTQRNKVLGIIQQLADAGLSDADIMDYFQTSQGLGRASLQDYFNTAGTAISQQFQPQFDQASNFLGANPLLADSGYSNRLNRQLLTDLGSRLTSDYGQRAADESSRNVGFYRDLVGQRTGLRGDLARGGYQTMAMSPKKQKSNVGYAIGQIGGAVAGGLLGGPPGAAAGSQLGSSLAYSSPPPSSYATGSAPLQQYPTMMRRSNRPFGDY